MSAQAQWPQLGNKLVVTANANMASQGYAVAISGDANTLVVGGPRDSNGIGAAWIYTFNGSDFVHSGTKILGAGNIGNASFGSSVAISSDGKTAIIGGPDDNNKIGAAWIFTFNGINFVQAGNKLVGSGVSSTISGQGTSVSISADGKTAIVGGPNDNSRNGAVWIYTLSGDSFIQVGDRLIGSGGTTGQPSGQMQGQSVSISGDGKTAIVGGPLEGNSSGAVWVYTFNGTSFIQVGNKLVSSINESTEDFGLSLNISADGKTAIIGAEAGFYIFTFNGTSFDQAGNKLMGNGNIGSSFISSVSISANGKTAVIGSENDNGAEGAIWIYTFDGTGFIQSGNKIIGKGNIFTAFQGSSVSISGDGKTVIEGGPSDSTSRGAVWVFKYDPSYTITGIHTFDSESSYKVYPNPSNGSISIEAPEETTIRIINFLGTSLIERKIKEKVLIEDLKAGIYFVEFTSGMGIKTTKKLIIL